ncbi:putative callose synthase 8 [Musa acuminata AAA Group]|uniref:putative callose synthase 8 n=1 Tax=Musa acuminata AAA Group TaxID=214697 RepID=UPI0031DEDB7A
MVLEVGLEKGFQTAIGEFILMQLQLACVVFTYQLGTKAHYYGRTILHGGAKYRTTGHGFVLFHAKFSDNYRMYSRSHFCLRTRAVDIVDCLLSIWKFTSKLDAVPVRHVFCVSRLLHGCLQHLYSTLPDLSGRRQLMIGQTGKNGWKTLEELGLQQIGVES